MVKRFQRQASRPLLTHWHLILVAAVFGALQTGSALTWGIPCLESWAVDLVGGRHAVQWANDGMGYGRGFARRYPPMHQYLLTAVNAPIRACEHIVSRSAPVASEAVEDGSMRRWSMYLAVDRLMTVAMAIGVILIIYRLGNTLGSPGAGLIGAGFWAGNYLGIYYGMTTNLDVPYVFWFVLGVERLLNFHQHHRSRDLVVSAIAAAAAVATKDQAAALVFALPLLLLFGPVARRSSQDTGGSEAEPGPLAHTSSWLARPHLSLLVWLAVAGVAYGLASQALIRPLDYARHVRAVFGPGLGQYQDQIGPLDLLIANLRLLLGSAHPFLVSLTLAGVGIGLSARTRVSVWLLLPALTYALTFLLPSRLLAVQFLLPVTTLMFVVAGIGWSILVARLRLRLRRPLSFVLSVGLLVTGLPFYLMLWNDPRAQADRWLAEHPTVAESIATHCRIRAYLPVTLQPLDRRIEPVNGYPEPSHTPYLLVPEHGVLDRYMSQPDVEAGQAWLALVNEKSGCVREATFRPSWPVLAMARSPAEIMGLTQTIYVLRDTTLSWGRAEATVTTTEAPRGSD